MRGRRRLDHGHAMGRNDRHGRPCRRGRDGRSLGHHRGGWRFGGNGGRHRWGSNNIRRLANRGNDSSRLGARRGRGWLRRGRMRHRDDRGGGPGGRRLRSSRCRRPGRGMAPPRRQFFFLLLGLDRLQHIAGLGDVGQVDLGLRGLLCPRLRARRVAGRLAGPVAKMRAHAVGLVPFKRTGVRLRLGHAEFRKNVQDRAWLDFQLACEIVDSYLAHPPLFGVCYQKP
jgi:hypothetical protein